MTNFAQTTSGLYALRYFVITLIYMALLSFSPEYANAKVYKYIDQTGKIHYGDRPFSYRQDDFREGRSNEHYKDKKIDPGKFLGLWGFEGYSKHLGNATTPAKASWLFLEDGSMKIQKKGEISNTRFRFQNNLVEIVEDRVWTIYNVISLSDKKLVIFNPEEARYYHFSKKDDQPLTASKRKSAVSLLYRREQVAKLIVMFTCTGVIYSELSPEEKQSKMEDIFMISGINRFNEKKFSQSVIQYKSDPVFSETYLPRITSDVRTCANKVNMPTPELE